MNCLKEGVDGGDDATRQHLPRIETISPAALEELCFDSVKAPVIVVAGVEGRDK